MLRNLLLISAAVFTSGCATYGPARHGETIYPNVVYAVQAGKKLHVDLYVPRTSRPAPVIVWIHGGGWKYGDKGYHLSVRELTDEGFAIASVQYRLLRAAPWPAQVEDCEQALAWIRNNGRSYGIDPTRMALAGESAGGHLAALIGTRETRRRVKEVLAMYPPTDLLLMGRRYAQYGRFSVFSQMFGGPNVTRRAEARAASPVTYVRRDSPPFLVYHGAKDWLVPPEQSEALDAALRKAGVESHLVIVPEKGHAFSLDRAQLREVAAFFHRHL